MNDRVEVAKLRRAGVRGYCENPSIAPGESMKFYVSCDEPGTVQLDLVRLVHGDTNPKGPGFKEEVIDHPANGEYGARRQRTQIGSYVIVPDGAARLSSDNLTAHLFVQTGMDSDKRQGLVSRWVEDDAAGWAVYLEDGYLHLAVGDGAARPVVAKSERRLFPHVWYSVTAVIDGHRNLLTLRQKSVVNAVNSRLGPVANLDTDFSTTVPCSIRPLEAAENLLIGGLAEATSDGERTWVGSCFNGKIDSPSVFGRTVDSDELKRLDRGDRAGIPGLIAGWDFSHGIGPAGIGTDAVFDISGNALHGSCVNQPERACTGWNWEGKEDNFIHAAAQYGAICFHEDALDDCRWSPDLELTIPDSLKSGCYALRAVQNDCVEHIPFFVLPPRGTATARILVLIPTCSYLAYANWQIVPASGMRQGASGRPYVLNDFDVEMNMNFADYGLSVYDTHINGRSVKYTSWRRPISNMRPMHRHREFGAPWGFPADLHLIDWLDAKGYDFDVGTDHDLIAEGADLLRRYRVVLTGSHPEYYTGSMIDAWEEYLAGGGRGMYLGGNGMYWVVSLHPEKPWVMETRKGESGTSRLHATPGEFHHSTSGERGGLWRHRARPSQKVWGTGFISHGMDSSSYFVQMEDARSPDARWVLEGIGEDEVIGDFGLVGDGASGYEIDVYDPALGTPPNTLLLACSVDHTRNYQMATEELGVSRPGMNGQEHPDIRGDITLFHTANNGAMFASSSISWCGSLSWNNYDNNVSRLTGNVLSAFENLDVLPS